MAGMAGKKTGESLNPATEERRRLLVNGIVQGVGFRPFVYRLAVRFALKGFIRNTPSGVLIELQGPANVLEEFRAALQRDHPPLAKIVAIEESVVASVAEEGFVIGDSTSGSGMETLIPPDIALCTDCRRELYDPADRRFRYPFINCTNCGPRYTIVERLPYDRPFTSMRSFTLCPECEREYHDPLDRRFHAEPTACPVCGPKLTLLDACGKPMPGVADAVAEASALLGKGKIVALKGLGGFHLAVDALNDDAVRRLRVRKGREAKPFAVMMRDMALVRLYCELCDEEASALSSPEAPIVLLKKKKSCALASSVALGNDRLGVMLPYTPLHSLLFDEGTDLLVMTSANFSEEPIVSENAESILRLHGIADAFLVHDRPIYLKCDDSVTIFLSGELRQIRRSRGYVPAPVYLREEGATVLGTGGELKNTVTLLKGSHALMSQHIGDMKNFEAYRHFQRVALQLQHLFQATPELLVHDLHPDYMTTQWAMKQTIPLLGVQHHHAHLASCLAERGEEGPAIGLLLDGTGYGTDGTIWGGELLIGDASGATRFASLEPMPLPGGESAIMQPWRAAVGYLSRTLSDLPELPFMQERAIEPLLELLEKRVNVAETSSCGRLFDAVAAMCNLRGEISYEGEAAIALMHEAGATTGSQSFRYGFREGQGRTLMLLSPIIQDVAAAVLQGMSSGEISRRFHRTLVCAFLEIIQSASRATAIRTVVLSGGVFQNALLFETLVSELDAAGYRVLTHSLVPSNDGGLSLGQAVIGRQYLKGTYNGVQ
ncbi:MAG: carbamoyltransferase HypF [Chlorobium sp.]|nr:MAG: carbamoyltransferase HypF [Chlorobium sp.]